MVWSFHYGLGQLILIQGRWTTGERHFETKGVKNNHLSQTTNWESWQQKWSTPTLCHTSTPGAGSSVKALVPFPGRLGLLELWETVHQGPKQASCLGLAPSLGQRAFLKAGGDFTITGDYSIAAYLVVVVPSQGRIRWCHSTQEGTAVSDLKKCAQPSGVVWRSGFPVEA